jgi:hypothetical protein
MAAHAKLASRSLPREWRLSPEGTYTQISFAMCNITRIPVLIDGQGRLKSPKGEEAFEVPTNLILDAMDQEAEGRAKAQAAREAEARKKEAQEQAMLKIVQAAKSPSEEPEKKKKPAKKVEESSSSDDDDDESDESDESESESSGDDDGSDDDDETSDGGGDDDDGDDGPLDEKPKGSPCVSVCLPSNHIHEIDAQAFGGMPHLRSHNLSTNHIDKLALNGEATPRLSSLSLRNNQIGSFGSLGELTSLRRLDLSFNRLTNLRGVEGLTQLRVLLASGNQLRGPIPDVLRGMSKLTLLDLSHNSLDGAIVAPLEGLVALSTLRLSHNQLPSRALAELASILSRLSLIRRLELYANPLMGDASYPDSLLRAQPSLVQVDHMRQPAGELAAGMTGVISRRSVAEAIDAIANAALAQHAVQLERHRSAHASLLDALREQEAEAAHALEEYKSITSKAEDIFRDAIAEAKRAGSKSEVAVNRVLDRRKELLESERKSKERYRAKLHGSFENVQHALANVAAEVAATGLTTGVAPAS